MDEHGFRKIETSNSPETATELPASQTDPPKAHTCDQCRRRKVKCDTGSPCDRCVQSRLRCTRDIIRKRKGPKKGSRSVMKKLRNESELALSLSAVLPRNNTHQPDLLIQASHRTISEENTSLSSLEHQFEPPYGPKSDPLKNIMGPGTNQIPIISSMGLAPVPQQRLKRPSIDFLLVNSPFQYPSASSRDAYLSVNDLAHRIFDSDGSSTQLNDLSTMSPHPGSAFTHPFKRQPTPNDGMISPTATVVTSPPTLSVMSQQPFEVLYQSGTAPVQVEAQIAILAAQIGMSATFMSQCMKQYFRHLYPTMPILHEGPFYHRLTQPRDPSADEKCLLLSICAVTVLLAAPPSDLNFEGIQNLGRQFISHCVELRKDSIWIEAATPTTIITSYFISISFCELRQPRAHHFYLREAIGMAREQGFHLDSSYAELDRTQAICNRRVFALLFITERACAITRNKPTSIEKPPTLPAEHLDDEDPSILAGIQCIYRLFSLLDEKFVELWRVPVRNDEVDASQLNDIASIQRELNAMSFEHANMNDVQKADVLVTYQWLRLVFWQASMRQGLLSSSAKDLAFRYDYPIPIAKSLCRIMNQLSLVSILVHGIGIVCHTSLQFPRS
jgi:Fungal specific transcription factor domain/Fungal Zn(2)-Cys(6) binuclear cluster domain